MTKKFLSLLLSLIMICSVFTCMAFAKTFSADVVFTIGGEKYTENVYTLSDVADFNIHVQIDKKADGEHSAYIEGTVKLNTNTDKIKISEFKNNEYIVSGTNVPNGDYILTVTGTTNGNVPFNGELTIVVNVTEEKPVTTPTHLISYSKPDANGNYVTGTDEAKEGDEVTVTVHTAEDYTLTSLTANGENIKDTKKFTMSNTNVNVVAQFEEIPAPTGLYINGEELIGNEYIVTSTNFNLLLTVKKNNKNEYISASMSPTNVQGITLTDLDTEYVISGTDVKNLTEVELSVLSFQNKNKKTGNNPIGESKTFTLKVQLPSVPMERLTPAIPTRPIHPITPVVPVTPQRDTVVIEINGHTEEKTEEDNPNTGAEPMLGIVGAIALVSAAAVVISKKH